MLSTSAGFVVNDPMGWPPGPIFVRFAWRSGFDGGLRMALDKFLMPFPVIKACLPFLPAGCMCLIPCGIVLRREPCFAPFEDGECLVRAGIHTLDVLHHRLLLLVMALILLSDCSMRLTVMLP